MRKFLIGFGVVLGLSLIVLAGCSLWSGSASNDADALDLNSKTPTKSSQERAFAGLRWMLFAGVGLAALGAGLLFIPLPGLKSWSVPCFASGGFMAFMSIVLNQHYLLISWIGLGVGLAGIGLLVWMVWRNKDKLETAGIALIEVVLGQEDAKKVLPENLKKQLYGLSGDLFDKGLIGKKQSPTTELLVAKIRKNGDESVEDIK